MFSLFLLVLTSCFPGSGYGLVQEFTDIEAYCDIPMNVFSPGLYNKANIFLGLIEYELNNLLGASHFVDCISVHAYSIRP